MDAHKVDESVYTHVCTHIYIYILNCVISVHKWMMYLLVLVVHCLFFVFFMDLVVLYKFCRVTNIEESATLSDNSYECTRAHKYKY